MFVFSSLANALIWSPNALYPSTLSILMKLSWSLRQTRQKYGRAAKTGAFNQLWLLAHAGVNERPLPEVAQLSSCQHHSTLHLILIDKIEKLWTDDWSYLNAPRATERKYIIHFFVSLFLSMAWLDVPCTSCTCLVEADLYGLMQLS